MTKVEQLERQVAVLLEGLEPYAHDSSIGDVALGAIKEAARIAAEPVEPALEDLVREWTAGAPDSWVAFGPGKDRILLGDLDGYVPFPSVAEAMDWVRAQGEVPHG